MTWFNWYDVDLCFSHWCGVTGVLPGLESSPWFLPLGKVYTHRAPLHTTTYHYSPLSLHTTIFDSTQFYTKYIYLQWHFTALSTMHLFTPLNVITVTLQKTNLYYDLFCDERINKTWTVKRQYNGWYSHVCTDINCSNISQIKIKGENCSIYSGEPSSSFRRITIQFVSSQ